MIAIFVLLLLSAAAALAQNAVIPSYSPLDLEQKYMYSLDRIAGASAAVGFAARAAIDQVWNKPASWGDGSESYTIAAATHFGDRFLHENIAFGVRALAHEDPRYFGSGRGSVWQRTRFAVAHTFAVRNDNGSLMPAYSLFVSCYVTPAIAREWHPGPYTLGREAPDLARHLPRRIREWGPIESRLP